MLWNPEVDDEMLKLLRAVITVYAPTTINHKKCVLNRKKEIGQLWFCHLRTKQHFPSSQQEQLISLQNYCPGVEINKNHFPIVHESQENLRE